MTFSFQSILVPVDFSINTEVAVKKALQVADKEGAVISLLHVTGFTVSTVVPGAGEDEPVIRAAVRTPEHLLAQWKDMIEDEMSGVEVRYSVVQHSSVQQCILEHATDMQADLIVIGKNSNHKWMPFLNTVSPVELAEKTGSAVLTVKPGSLHNQIKTLVVPVTESIPQHKMEAISALCRKNKLRVHLVLFSKDDTPMEHAASTLLKVFQWIRQNLQCHVECAVLQGSNKARAIMAYAEKINADVLMVDTASESRVGWMNAHIPDVLSPGSKMQVLAIHGTH